MQGRIKSGLNPLENLFRPRSGADSKKLSDSSHKIDYGLE